MRCPPRWRRLTGAAACPLVDCCRRSPNTVRNASVRRQIGVRVESRWRWLTAILRAIVAALRICPSCCCLQYCRCVLPARLCCALPRLFSAAVVLVCASERAIVSRLSSLYLIVLSLRRPYSSFFRLFVSLSRRWTPEYDPLEDAVMEMFLVFCSSRFVTWGSVKTAKTHVVEFMRSMLGVVPPPIHGAAYTAQKLRKPLANRI